MHHIEEQTLAFYAMGVDLPPSDRAAIEDHLRSCAGCRSQVEELREINAFVAERTEATTPDPGHTFDALERIPHLPARHFDAPPIRKPHRMVTRFQRVTGIVRRHPISTGSGILLLGLLSFAVIREVATQRNTAEQPVAVRMNAVGSALEVVGARNTELWKIPISPKFRSVESDEFNLTYNTRICDLDDDGNMEVITGAPYPDGENVVTGTLRIFTHDGRVRYLTGLGIAPSFDGSAYANNFAIAGLIVITPAGAHEKEIFVSLTNDRSPSCLVRLTPEGKVLGEYWHFGWLRTPHMVRLTGEDHDCIILMGVNDVEYRTNDVFPSLVVLDPASIAGRTESRLTRGFGYSESKAELYYVAAGNTDARLISGTATSRPGFDYGTKIAQDSSFTVTEAFTLPVDFPKIMYTFDGSLSLSGIWFSDTDRIILNDRFLTRKTPEGQDEFVRDLISKVRWWDGTTWQNRPVRIGAAKPSS